MLRSCHRPIAHRLVCTGCSSQFRRPFGEHSPFETGLDPEQLSQARSWRQSFSEDSIPKGSTSYARSSGPGGQHVNKTESKAITVWSVKELSNSIPTMLHASLRSSKYYSARSDAFQIQAQTHRDRSANANENRQKLIDEIKRIYREAVPGETSEATMRKQENMEKTFHAGRLAAKKRQSAKKASRKGF